MAYPLNIYGFPQAILHLDANAFFASVEQATNPHLKGKPVVVGKERGIVTAVSYEGKALGIKRGMTIVEVQRKFPEAIVLESDYEKYSLFSMRMFEILRRLLPVVEEYSIDEAFADLTGMRRYLHKSYEEIGNSVKEAIKAELGITVSIGISLTKVLAKIASDYQKPDGLTLISGREIHHYLKELPIEEVWGIGPQTSALCHKLGIHTALEFASAPEDFIKKHFNKPIYEIWLELRGIPVFPVINSHRETYKSISKALSFKPTEDRDFLLAQLSFNLERACLKARAYGLYAQRVIVFLKDEEFIVHGEEILLPYPSAYPQEILPYLTRTFQSLAGRRSRFRQVGVVLTDLTHQRKIQQNLFGRPISLERAKKVPVLYEAIDKINYKYGRTTLVHGVSLPVTKERPLKKGSSLRIPLLKVTLE